MKLRNITISSLAMALVAGSAVGVAAQDAQADPMAPATFAWDVSGEAEQGFMIEANDPRASGEMSLGELPSIQTDTNGVWSLEGRLVNDGGAWVGIGREMGGWTNDPAGGDWQDGEFDTEWEVGIAMWEMTGEDGYDGLSLILFSEHDYDDVISVPHPISWGIIFPSEPVAE